MRRIEVHAEEASGDGDVREKYVPFVCPVVLFAKQEFHTSLIQIRVVRHGDATGVTFCYLKKIADALRRFVRFAVVSSLRARRLCHDLIGDIHNSLIYHGTRFHDMEQFVDVFLDRTYGARSGMSVYFESGISSVWEQYES